VHIESDSEQKRLTMEHQGHVPSWVESLTTTCLTLAVTPATVIRTTSVTVALTEGLEEERDAIALAERLAEQYGFQAQIELQGHVLTVRFERQYRDGATQL
jgi:ABC-type molybdate transport system substrate-binding protein